MTTQDLKTVLTFCDTGSHLYYLHAQFLSLLLESTVVHDFLRKELLPCTREPNFNLTALTHSPSCRRSISEIIRRVQRNLQFASEEEVVMKVIELICCETAKDLIGIRRCEALCYELIISLASDQGNAFHCSKGEAMRQRGS